MKNATSSLARTTGRLAAAAALLLMAGSLTGCHAILAHHFLHHHGHHHSHRHHQHRHTVVHPAPRPHVHVIPRRRARCR